MTRNVRLIWGVMVQACEHRQLDKPSTELNRLGGFTIKTHASFSCMLPPFWQSSRPINYGNRYTSWASPSYNAQNTEQHQA